ncbi:MAG: glycosyltransferase family 4 protein [Gemmatimonadaceae bacterium]
MPREFANGIAGARIAMILTNPFAPDRRVLKEATSLAEAGADVVIFAWDRSGSYPSTERVTPNLSVRRFHVRSENGLGARQLPRFLQYWRVVAKAIRAESWDVIHAHDLDGLVAASLCSRAARRVVFDAHELFPLMVEEKLGAIAGRAAWGIERQLLKVPHLVITDGEARARVYRNVLGVPEVVSLENTVDAGSFGDRDALRAVRRAELGIPSDAWVIGVFTFLSQARSLDLLWQAAAELNDVYIVVCGDGAGAAKVRELAKRNVRVRFLGHVRDVESWYATTDMIYYAVDPGSRNSRLGFPNNVGMAVGAGIPILTTNVGFCAHLVRRYGLGKVMRAASVENVCESVAQIRNPDTYRELVASAQRARERLSWKRSERELLEAYQRLLRRTN